jgi:hypothetical protein
MARKPASKKQAALFGAIAGGKRTKATGLSKRKAHDILRGKKLKGLPARSRKSR